MRASPSRCSRRREGSASWRAWPKTPPSAGRPHLPIVAGGGRPRGEQWCVPCRGPIAGARARPAGRRGPGLGRGDYAGHPDRLLGSAPPPNGRAAAPRAGGLPISGRLPAASATPSKTRRHGTSADGVLGAAPPTAGSHSRCGITLPVAELAKTRDLLSVSVTLHVTLHFHRLHLASPLDFRLCAHD